MQKAIFLDRDGLINQLIFNPNTDEYESPHYPEDFVLMPGVLEAIKSFSDIGYLLFVITNQPSYAKGKTSMENIEEIHAMLKTQMADYGIPLTEYYSCHHHPQGIVPEYSGECDCRKPKPFFLQRAAKDYNLDLAHSWMIGDQDSDIDCGKNAGVQTIMVPNDHSIKKRGESSSDYVVKTLSNATEILAKAF